MQSISNAWKYALWCMVFTTAVTKILLASIPVTVASNLHVHLFRFCLCTVPNHMKIQASNSKPGVVWGFLLELTCFLLLPHVDGLVLCALHAIILKRRGIYHTGWKSVRTSHANIGKNILESFPVQETLQLQNSSQKRFWCALFQKDVFLDIVSSSLIC